MFYSNDVGDQRSGLFDQGRPGDAADSIGKYRLPAVKSFDARIEKMFTFDRDQVAFDFDIFNVFNHGTVLGRIYDVVVDAVQPGRRDHEPAHRALRGARAVLDVSHGGSEPPDSGNEASELSE